jgi:DNA-binding SARP family transcriptional activator
VSTWFGALGPLEIRADGVPVPITRPRHRSLVAVLLAEPNRVVSVDEVIDRVWGVEPPATARTQVHVMVSAVRRALPDGDAVLHTQSSGYLLAVTPDTFDVLAFDVALAAARTAADPAERLRAAVDLWRGEPFTDVAGDFLATPRRVLTERYLAAAEQLADLRLDRGEQRAVAEELRGLVAAYPLREGLRRRLMLALYRQGDAAGALRVYAEGERTLAEDHGLDPSAALTELAERIRAGDGLATARRVPRQLPLAPAHFTGRATELAALDAALRSGTRVLGIVGTGGVGKTGLATHWAHAVAAAFPDGQLYVDLRGFDPDAPLPPAEALAALLRSLGVSAQDIPADLDDRSALFGSTADGRKLLLLLDNARDAEHVRPLLPATGPCCVVTSRDSLADLSDAHVVALDTLDEADAVALLGALVGDRVAADPDAATRLADRCVRLPLALRIAAERAAERADTPLADLVAELADERAVLGALDTGDDPHTAVAAVFSWSYRQLSPALAGAFRLLGLHRGPHVGVAAAAALLAVDQQEATELLAGLRRVSLVESVDAQRFSMHDLLRVFAAERAGEADAEPDRLAALSRVDDHYLAGAAAAMDALYPAEKDKRPVLAEPAPRPGPAVARRWLDAELPNLLAVGDDHVIPMCATVWRHLETLGRYDEAATLGERSIRVAERTGNDVGYAFARTVTGQVRWRQGRFDAAREHLTAAAAAYGALGDPAGRAWVLLNLGVVDERARNYAAAAEHLHEAITGYRALGDDGGLADALGNLGVVYEQTGDHERALRLQKQAFGLHLDGDNPTGQANALGNIGILHHRAGRHESAVSCLRQAIALFGGVGDRAGEAEALAYLGASLHALGDPDAAREHLDRALALATDLASRRVQANALNGLGDLARASGDMAQAHTAHTAALRHATAVGDAEQQARAEAALSGLTSVDPMH